MIRWIRASFRRQLNLAIIGVSLVPLLLTSLFLIQLLRQHIDQGNAERSNTQAEQLSDRLDTLLQEMEAASSQISLDPSIRDAIDESDRWMQNKAYQQLYRLSAPVRKHSVLYLYNGNGSLVYSTGNQSQENLIGQKLPLYWGILRSAQKANGPVITGSYSGEHEQLPGLTSACTIRNENGTIAGYLVAYTSSAGLDALFSDILNAQEGLSLLDAYWRPLYEAGTAVEAGGTDTGGVGEKLRALLLSGKQIPHTLAEQEVLLYPLQQHNLTLVLLRPQIFTDPVVYSMYRILLLMMLLSFVLCILVAMRLSRSLNAPVSKITTAMRAMQEGNLDIRISSGRQDEFGSMAENFNSMAGELQNYMAAQLKAQQELDDSQVAMMQAQLNPHFLYNTLDTMKWLGKAGGVPEIATISTSLAKILRTAISGAKFLPLRNEIALVTSYVEIQKIRFDDSFLLVNQIPEALQDFIVPKLIIQPVVENAIIHGLEEVRNGRIELNARTEYVNGTETLFLSVYDNGVGMPEEMMELLNSNDRSKLTGHIGFYNVNTIIKLHYGEQYGMQVSLPAEGGTLVEISLPAILPGEEAK